MSLRSLNWALHLKLRPPTKKFVLLVLADYATEKGKTYPSDETIQTTTGMTQAQAEFALQGLVDDKLIRDTGQRVGDAGQTRVFQLLPMNKVPKLTGRKRSVPAEFTQAEEIYKLYPRPVAKPKSLMSINKAIKEFGFDFIKTRTMLFAKAWSGRTDIQLCPHSTTFFNQQRFNDDPKTWGVTSPARGTFVSLGPTFIEVKAIVEEKTGKDIRGWTSSFFNYWNHPKRNWMKNGKPIIWKEALSKQLAVWRAGVQKAEHESKQFRTEASAEIKQPQSPK